MIEGCGSEFDVEFVAGPFDGLEDIVVNVTGLLPPTYTYRSMDDGFEKSFIGEKVIEHWKKNHIPEDLRVAIYKLRGELDDYDEESEKCFYDFVRIDEFKAYKELTK